MDAANGQMANIRQAPINDEGLGIAALAVSLAVIGCSQQNNPVETTTVSPALAPAPLAKTTLITASQKIIARDGGTVRLQGTYETRDDREISYNLTIMFAPGALPADKTISITIDKNTFAQNAQVTFAPCGLVFNKPGALLIYAKGVTIAEEQSQLGLLYLNANVWQPMPSSWGMYFTNNGGRVIAGASIPQFSQYGSGRLLAD